MKKVLFFGSILILSLGANLPAIAQITSSIDSHEETILLARADVVYLEDDGDGNPCLRDRYGNKVYLEEDDDGDVYFEDDNGDRVYLREDSDGDVYYRDEDGERVYVEGTNRRRGSSSRSASVRSRDIYIETDRDEDNDRRGIEGILRDIFE
jgi:hypothetical protein